MPAPSWPKTSPPRPRPQHDRPGWGRKFISGISVIALLAVGLTTSIAATAASAADPALISQGKVATASSGTPANAVDGNLTSRWESAHSDPQWIKVDLGKRSSVGEIVLRWETARSKDFILEISDDDVTWTAIHTTTGAPSGADVVNTITPDDGVAVGRYVRMTGTARTTGYGHSLYEFEVYSSGLPLPPGPDAIIGEQIVTIDGTQGNWDLLVNDEPYTIKGMTWGPKPSVASSYMADLKAMGVNTIRTWGTDATSQELFDAAAEAGIRVIAGFWIQPGGGPGSGGCPDFVTGTDPYFDAVRDDVNTYVEMYKDHPAILMWDVGNESLIGLTSCYSGADLAPQQVAYTKFVNELAGAIHGLDANHPVTSTDAWVGAWPFYKDHAPNLDLYAINSYEALKGVKQAWLDGGYTKPYIVTEGGPAGEWEVDDDANGVPDEPTDLDKAKGYTDAWAAVQGHPGVALGATFFHFGVENDFGGVWFNVLTGGQKRLSYYSIARAFGGSAGQAGVNTSPQITAMTVPADGVAPGATFPLSATTTDPDGDAITYAIQFSGNYATGNKELVPAIFTGTAGAFTVTAPTSPGVWKVYVQATDGKGNVGIETRSITVASDDHVNVALTKTATASSGQDPAGNAVDGKLDTKWGSALDTGTWAGKDDEWFQVALGNTYEVDQVVITWEGAYGKSYDIQVSLDGTTWTTVAEVRNQALTSFPAVTKHTFAATNAKFVRFQGLARGTAFGYSFYEFQALSPTGVPVEEPGTGPGEGTPLTGITQTPQTVCVGDLSRASGVTASASHGNAADAIDGNVWSRWNSGVTDAGGGNWVGRDDEWIQIDLGSVKSVCGIKTYWEGAFGKDYDIRVSQDGMSWTTAAQVRGVSEKGLHRTQFDATQARYVQLKGLSRGTPWGYSLWDLNILGPVETSFPSTSLLGPNVLVFDPTMDASDIQAAIDSVFEAQEMDQFGEDRWQFMFAPGTYSVDARIGFYTSLSGAGLDPRDVDIHGADWVDADWFDMNATQNFWRSAENLSYTPTGGVGRWAVSQAAPFRRIQVNGDLLLDSGRYGWASGGYIADSNVTGYAKAFTQQQWYTRDSTIGTWAGRVWNVAFSGVDGKFALGDKPTDVSTVLPEIPGTWPELPVTALEHTGQIAEKPFLHLTGDDANSADDWEVFVPAVRNGTTGATWKNGPSAGTSLPLSTFFIVKEGTTATQVNAALAEGKNVLFTPGVYRMDKTIEVSRPNTVVLGLGLATIIPTGGGIGMHVADADGIRVAGLLFDAAVTESPALFVVGDKNVHVDHSANPIVVSDVFMRVGGAVAGKVDAAMVVNADDTIVDHVWSWRGDHGAGIGWDKNTSDYGFVVNGDDVSAYGLFVEHYQKYNTLWKGNNGRTVFYQNELPYDVPDQAAWQNGTVKGWAAYKVDNSVTKHEAWALGAYSNFTSDTEENEIEVDGGFEVPKKPNVQMNHMLVVSLGGEGIFNAVINGVGAKATGTETIPSYVAHYPDPENPDAGIDPPDAPEDPATNPETHPTDPGTPGGETPGGETPGGGTPGGETPGGETPGGGTPGGGTPGGGTPGGESSPKVVVTLSGSTVRAGGNLEVVASGFKASETVQVWLHSTPVLLASGEASKDGTVRLTVKIPAGTSVGEHSIVVKGLDSGASGSAPLRVTAAARGLAVTGSEALSIGLLAALSLGAGTALLVIRRRRNEAASIS